MKHFFDHSNASWVKYSKYEQKTDENRIAYILPAQDSVPEIYNPIKKADKIVEAALSIGAMCMRKEKENIIEQAIMNFVSDYGLLGIMTAVPTTASFMDYEAVYLTKNIFIKSEAMPTFEYLDYFFPFEKPDIGKRGIESYWNVGGDTAMMALVLTMGDRPMAVNLEFQKLYAERYDWIRAFFKDLAFIFISSDIYYTDYDEMTTEQRNLYQKSVALFDGISPTYHIELHKTPVIVWDFNSLATAIRMMFSLAMTDENNPLRLCKHCQKPFIASRSNAIFCSNQCKNRYNVYKTRKKRK